MSEIQFVRWVEIPVRIYGEYNRESGDGWHEPRIPAHVEINDIEICLKDDDTQTPENLGELKDSLLQDADWMDSIRLECWERRE